MPSSINIARERSLHSTHTTRGRELMQREVAGLQEQMSTGLRVNRASDDAGAYGRARKLDALTDRYAQYENSIEAARPWVTHTQDHLDRMAELLQQAHEQGVRGSNDTFSESDRADYARAIESLRDELIENLNAKVGDEYLFAGNKTDQPPFEDDSAVAGYGDPTLGAGNYGDINGDRTRRVGPGLDLKINIDGQQVHEVDSVTGRTITDSLQNLIDALRGTGTPPPAIEDALGYVDEARDHVINLGAEAGNVGRRLDASADQLGQSTIEHEARRSELEDADYAETIMRFQKKQGQLQAALQVSASVMQTSLLDYLR